MIRLKTFSTVDFKRAGGGVVFEERPAQPSDFDKLPENGDSYAKKFADSPSTFYLDYPNWQKFADYYIMRRAIVSLSGTQKCDTESFKGTRVDAYSLPGKIAFNKSMKVPGSASTDDIPTGKWLISGMNYTDNGDSTTTINVNFTQKKKWELIKIQDGNAPSPGGS